MPLKTMVTLVSGFPLLLAGITNISSTGDAVDMSGIIIRLTAFILGICGAAYLAAGLWHRSKKGSDGWKYLSISMVLFVLWNIDMTLGVLLDALNSRMYSGEISISSDSLSQLKIIVNVLDPILEVIVFIILFFGLRKIINAMRNEPWTVFSEGESNE